MENIRNLENQMANHKGQGSNDQRNKEWQDATKCDSHACNETKDIFDAIDREQKSAGE